MGVEDQIADQIERPAGSLTNNKKDVLWHDTVIDNPSFRQFFIRRVSYQ